MNLLKFGRGNAKLGKDTYTFSIPSGYTCPFAKDCLSKSDRKTGKIKDGPHTQFRCFSASQETLYPNVRESRWNNFELLKKARTAIGMFNLLYDSLPTKAKKVRIHVSGDFFSQAYFDAWCAVAVSKPNILFYAYTKALPYWLARKKDIPANLVLTASYGGTNDNLIIEHDLRYSKVVFSEDEAKMRQLPIDHDDSHASNPGGSFALLVHGIQPAGSEASKAVSALKKKGLGFYSRKTPLMVVD